jgi:hypothetical protein
MFAAQPDDRSTIKGLHLGLFPDVAGGNVVAGHTPIGSSPLRPDRYLFVFHGAILILHAPSRMRHRPPL